MKTKEKSLCETCINKFYIKFIIRASEHAYIPEKRAKFGLITEHSECIYRPDLRYDKPHGLSMEIIEQEILECTFYNKKIEDKELSTIRSIKDDVGIPKRFQEGYQDLNRTYTSSERQLENRRDCRNVA